ncbi:LrgB family protein [Salinispirillum marinum]|uniref:LrgB family protein n=2 Tax=Saccharospirillaceae TaxID=255527 RepID=A0ABV8BG10_9GAMM
MNDLLHTSFWVYFAARPLLWLLVTIACFLLARWLSYKVRGMPLLNPVLVSMIAIITLLTVTGTDYNTYFSGAQFIHFLLGPATVALAIPLYDYLPRIRALFMPIMVACLIGALVAVVTALGIGVLLGASPELLLALAPKSVTSPIAIGIAEKIGAFPSLTAGLVLITGVIGCVLAPPLFRVLRIEDDAIKGFSLGLAAHGFGTAQAIQMSMMAGAFAGLGMSLTGVFSSFLVPLMVGVFGLLG